VSFRSCDLIIISAGTHRAPYLPNGKAYKLQTWYTYGGRQPTSATGAMTSKVKGQGHTGPLMLTHIMRHIFRMARPTNFKLAIRMQDDTHVSHRRHDLQGQRSRSQGHVISLSRLSPMLYLCH